MLRERLLFQCRRRSGRLFVVFVHGVVAIAILRRSVFVSEVCFGERAREQRLAMFVSKLPSERPDDASCLVFERPLSKPRKLTLYLVGHALHDRVLVQKVDLALRGVHVDVDGSRIELEAATARGQDLVTGGDDGEYLR